MSDVVDLNAIRLAPVPEVVEGLEDLLDRARRGEIRGYAIGAAADQNCDASAFVIGDSSIAAIYLGIERAKLRLLEHED